MPPPGRYAGAVLTLIVLATAAHDAIASDRVFRLYDRQHGLPTDEVADVTQDAAGFLWIATPGGLVRFDGSEMRRWDTRGRRIHKLAAARIGVLAIDEADRLLRVTLDGRVEDLRGPDGRPLTGVLDVAVDATERIWVLRGNDLLHGTEPGVWTRVPYPRFGGERPRHVRADRGSGVFVLTAEGIWIATADGQVRRAFEVASAVDAARQPNGDVMVLASGAFVATEGGAVRRLFELTTARPIDLLVREGSTWVAFDRFVARLAPDAAPTLIGPEHGLPSGGRLFVDREGSLWICTFRGLLQYPEPETIIWSERDGLPSTHARFLGRSDEGLWVSTWGGLVRIDPAAGVPQVDRVGPQHVGDVCIDGTGGLWYGGDTLRYRARHTTRIQPFPNTYLRFCTPARDGSIWLGLDGRLVNASPAGLHEIGVPVTDAPDPTYPAPMLEDSDGWLWVAYPSRVCRRQVADVRSHADWTCDALPASVDPTAMIETSDTLWLATHSHGVLRRGDETWQTIPASLDLGGGRVFKLRPGRNGTIWVLGLGAPTRVADRPDSDAGWEVVERLSAWHGYPSGGTSDLLEEPDGTIWTAGAAGVVRIPGYARRDAPAPPAVQLSGVMLDGRAVPPGARLSMTHGRNLLELRFAALTYRDRALLRYQTRIGSGEHWTELTPGDPVLRFAELPSGAYLAEFRASLDRRTWSSQPSRLAFHVRDPWYLQPWFFAAAAAGLGVLLLAAHRTRLRLALRLERQRTQIAMDLHDEIGSGLGSIGILAGIANTRSTDPTTQSLLADIGDTAGELSTSLGDIVWSLRPGSRTLQELLERIAERGQRLFPDETTPAFACDFPDTRDPVVLELNVRRNVLLIVAEALHNAATHAKARRVDVVVAPDLPCWRIRVSDDGRGFDPASVSRPGGGLGLSSMRRRAAEIAADLDVRSRPGGGTAVSLLFHPLGRGHRHPTK